MAARPERHRGFLAAPRGILKIRIFLTPFGVASRYVRHHRWLFVNVRRFAYNRIPCGAAESEVPMKNIDVKIKKSAMAELEAKAKKSLSKGASFSLECPGCGRSYDAAIGSNRCPYCGFVTDVSLG